MEKSTTPSKDKRTLLWECLMTAQMHIELAAQYATLLDSCTKAWKEQSEDMADALWEAYRAIELGEAELEGPPDKEVLLRCQLEAEKICNRIDGD